LNGHRPSQDILDFYTQTAVMTSPGNHAQAFAGLPGDVSCLAPIVQGLLLHEHLAPAYGETLSDERRSQVHTRPTQEILDHLLAPDGLPLTAARPVETRHIGNCRHFSLLVVAMLRDKGVPARARCGFGAYFDPDHYVDHWVCEYWNAEQERWILADAQIDETQQAIFHTDFDLMDVPRDKFLIAGDAWTKCRAGEADPDKFGIMDMHGLWFIAGNVLRDFAALNNMEMLPWDVWGGMVMPNQEPQGELLELYDQLAAITLAPDPNFAELRARYENDDRLHVPKAVFNAVANRVDAV
jgi:Transglutaminase-like superfamily